MKNLSIDLRPPKIGNECHYYFNPTEDSHNPSHRLIPSAYHKDREYPYKITLNNLRTHDHTEDPRNPRHWLISSAYHEEEKKEKRKKKKEKKEEQSSFVTQTGFQTIPLQCSIHSAQLQQSRFMLQSLTLQSLTNVMLDLNRQSLVRCVLHYSIFRTLNHHSLYVLLLVLLMFLPPPRFPQLLLW